MLLLTADCCSTRLPLLLLGRNLGIVAARVCFLAWEHSLLRPQDLWLHLAVRLYLGRKEVRIWLRKCQCILPRTRQELFLFGTYLRMEVLLRSFLIGGDTMTLQLLVM